MIDERCANTDWMVEATEYEGDVLRRFWSDNPYGIPMPWTNQHPTRRFDVGDFHGHPVCIILRWARVGPLLVCFWEPTSQVVSHPMIGAWLAENFPRAIPTKAIDFNVVAADVRERMERTGS